MRHEQRFFFLVASGLQAHAHAARAIATTTTTPHLLLNPQLSSQPHLIRALISRISRFHFYFSTSFFDLFCSPSAGRRFTISFSSPRPSTEHPVPIVPSLPNPQILFLAKFGRKECLFLSFSRRMQQKSTAQHGYGTVVGFVCLVLMACRRLDCDKKKKERKI
jgi:hypothetical protein